MKSAKNTSNAITLISLIIVILGVGGWVANVYKLISNGFEIATWGGLEVARVIGVFIAPLGSILGFM